MAFFLDHLLPQPLHWTCRENVHWTICTGKQNVIYKLGLFLVFRAYWWWYSLAAVLNMLEIDDLTFWDSVVAENTTQTEL